MCDGEELVLPVPIPQDGVYTLELDILGKTLIKAGSFSAGDNATFDKIDLNESFTYTGRVKDSLGAQVSWAQDGTTYDCFQFTTRQKI